MSDKALPTLTVAIIATVFSGTIAAPGAAAARLQDAPGPIRGRLRGIHHRRRRLTAIGIEQLHMNLFVAGSGAALLGALPAIFIPFIVMRKAMNQIGLKDADLSSLMDLMSGVPGAPNLHSTPTAPQEEESHA